MTTRAIQAVRSLFVPEMAERNGRFCKEVFMRELSQIQMGDEVAFVSETGDFWLRLVARVFSSGEVAFELEDGSRYTAEGFEVGHDRTGRVLALTDAVRAHIRRQEYLRVVYTLDWRELTNSQLARVVAIIQEKEYRS
jgi:hypothetical protein